MKLKSEDRRVLVLVDNLDNIKDVEVETVSAIIILLFRLQLLKIGRVDEVRSSHTLVTYQNNIILFLSLFIETTSIHLQQ